MTYVKEDEDTCRGIVMEIGRISVVVNFKNLLISQSITSQHFLGKKAKPKLKREGGSVRRVCWVRIERTHT